MTTGDGGKSSRFQTGFPPSEFAERRGKVFDAIGDGAHALLQGAGPVRGFEVFRQSNDFYYLCGLEVPQSLLLLDGGQRTASVYLPHRDEAHARSEGAILSAEDEGLVRELTGADTVYGPEKLSEHLRAVKDLHVPHMPAEGRAMSRDVATGSQRKVAEDRWDGRVSREAHLIGLLMDRFPRIAIRDLSPILDELRLIKSPREIELLDCAAKLAGLAVMEAMRSTRPGVIEYQLGAIASYTFLSNGARGDGYRSIIAGGANAWYGHYFRNDCPLQGGDLVLMDCAPDYGYYTSDIGRMWPVNGKYSRLQRELYGFVVEYHKALLKRIRPGAMASDIMVEAAEGMAQVIEHRSFSEPVYEGAARRMLEFTGHLSHPVGMAVHDVGNYHTRPLAPGMVFTVDPQMWVHEEERYIRCEDTVVVTEDGAENLTQFVPLELDDVETLMGEEGLLQRYPAAFPAVG